MLTGVLGAAAQNDFRKILSFHIISQIGYMIMGLGFFTPLALTGAVFYIFHHIIVKSNLFLVSGLVNEIKGSYALKSLGGIWKAYPLLGLLFLIPALSLAGIPPLSGFWAKFTLTKAGIDLQQFLIIGVSLLVGLLTLFSMTKIWNEVFWKNDPDRHGNDMLPSLPLSNKIALVLPIVFLGICTLIIGFSAEPFFQVAAEAADQLLNPSGYIKSVMGGI
jgi:multicomponent Na+:H+ antiporter subunit D